MIFFKVQVPNKDKYCFTPAREREDAKRRAFPYLGAIPNRYVVTPLTKDGDDVVILSTSKL